jgi:hypothetical protein
MDRRDFLSASLMTVGALTSAQMAPLSAALLPPSVPAAEGGLNEASFRAMIGSRFQLTSSDWRGHVRLTEVRTGPQAARLEQFSAIFTGEDAILPASGLYEVVHPQAGRFALRLEGADGAARRTAAFARLRA